MLAWRHLRDRMADDLCVGLHTEPEVHTLTHGTAPRSGPSTSRREVAEHLADGG